MLNIFPFGVAVLKQMMSEAFPYTLLCKSLIRYDGAIHETLGTSTNFHPCQWCPM